MKRQPENHNCTLLSRIINIKNHIVFPRIASEWTKPWLLKSFLFVSVLADNTCFRVCSGYIYNLTKKSNTTPLDLVYPVMIGAECQALYKVTCSSDQFILTSSINYEQILRLFRCCKKCKYWKHNPLVAQSIKNKDLDISV